MKYPEDLALRLEALEALVDHLTPGQRTLVRMARRYLGDGIEHSAWIVIETVEFHAARLPIHRALGAQKEGTLPEMLRERAEKHRRSVGSPACSRIDDAAAEGVADELDYIANVIAHSAATDQHEGVEIAPWIDRPEWSAAGKVHDWRNHVHEGVREMWDTFTARQKLALYEWARDVEDGELDHLAAACRQGDML